MPQPFSMKNITYIWGLRELKYKTFLFNITFSAVLIVVAHSCQSFTSICFIIFSTVHFCRGQIDLELKQH